MELSCENDEKNDKKSELFKSSRDDINRDNSSIIKDKNKKENKDINFYEYMNINIDLTLYHLKKIKKNILHLL